MSAHNPKLVTDNLFQLFDDKPGWQEAEVEIKKACIRFQAEIRALQERHADVGASDTDSREAIGAFVGSLIGGCTDSCLDPEWHVINRYIQGYHIRNNDGLTWGLAREECVKAGLLPADVSNIFTRAREHIV
jgi:hypothetical protein